MIIILVFNDVLNTIMKNLDLPRKMLLGCVFTTLLV